MFIQVSTAKEFLFDVNVEPLEQPPVSVLHGAGANDVRLLKPLRLLEAI